MAERIVVGFLTEVTAATLGAGAAYLRRAIDLCKKAEARGGRLCAFGSQSIAFDFGVDDLEEAISLATSELDERQAGSGAESSLVPWGMGLAQGDLSPLADGGSLAAPSWGPPLVVAIGLARIARPGELLVDPDVPAAKEGEILTFGTRGGKDGPRRVRGLVIDPRHIFRRETAEKNMSQLGRPPFLARHGAVSEVLASHAPLALVRADPGLGGTRFLEEIEALLLPARSLFLCTAGAEPLGALKQAFARSIAAHGPIPSWALPDAHRMGLERLLAGVGLDLGLAALLVARWVGALDGRSAQGSSSSGAVLVDDAMEVDDPSLEAIARASNIYVGSFRLVVRLDATSPVPPLFAGKDVGPEINLGPLSRSSGEQLANSFTLGQLSPEAQKRWARRGRYLPLGVLESIAEGITTGELSWVDGVAAPRSRSAGLRLQLDPKEWIQRRLEFVPAPAKEVLAIVALLGAQVSEPLVQAVVQQLALTRVSDHLDALCRTGWLVRQAKGFYGLPSRTHREVVLCAVPDEKKIAWHAAASIVTEELGGALGCAEAARHAVLSGNQPRAIELALVAARASRDLNLDDASAALFAFAGGEPEATASPAPRAPVAAPTIRLDSWIEALRAGGVRDGAADRLQAIVALAKGETPEALKALREGVTLAQDAAPVIRSRAALAYGIALAVSGRQTEALIAALDALARAREGNEPLGEQACERFLARLSLAAGHRGAALKWQRLAGEKGP